MPLVFRAKGVSISTATNWAFNWLVGEVTPYLQESIHWRLYPMHGFFCICSFVLVYFVYPETKGVPLEEMDAVFGEDELEERLENESETNSLLAHSEGGRSVRSISGSIGGEGGGVDAHPLEWVMDMYRRWRHRNYEPIRNET